MIADLRPYPTYRDSGVPWLGAIPSHWVVDRGKSLFRKMARPAPADAGVVTCFRDGTVTLRSKRRAKGYTEAIKEIGYQGVCRGDLVIHAMDAFAGAVGVSDSTGKCTPVYSVCQANSKANPWYFANVVREMARNGWVLAIAKGIRERSTDFRFSEFGQLDLPVPPKNEQQAIANFLEYADRRIKRYIRAKRQLIGLLTEQKQATIHRAVTRGLDPNVRLKPSGVEWLGDIPEHWGHSLLGSLLVKIEQGWSPRAAEGQLGPDQWAVLTLSAVKRGTFNSAAVKPIPDALDVPSHLEVKPGDFLLTRSNTRERVGDVCIVDRARPRTILCDLIYRIQPKLQLVEPGFLLHCLLSTGGRFQIETEARGSSDTMPKISHAQMRRWRVPLPPLEEQRAIAAYLQQTLGRIARLHEQLATEIDLLSEYRTRLIADVVTGKLDVRAAAAALPAELEVAEELPELDEMEAEDGDEAELADAEE